MASLVDFIDLFVLAIILMIFCFFFFGHHRHLLPLNPTEASVVPK